MSATYCALALAFSFTFVKLDRERSVECTVWYHHISFRSVRGLYLKTFRYDSVDWSHLAGDRFEDLCCEGSEDAWFREGREFLD